MFSRLLAGPDLPADQRSVVPSVRGLPWWGATLLATAITAIGAVISIDGSNGLNRYFKIALVIGGVLAVLLVKRRALFTAAVQPPLIAFVVGLVGMYTLSDGELKGTRDLILKVVLPIANTFPWMLIAVVLTTLIALGRAFFTGPVADRPFGGRPFVKSGGKTGSKQTGSKQSGAKQTGSKQTGPKQTGSKQSRPKSPAPSAAAGSKKKSAAEPARRRPAAKKGAAEAATARGTAAARPSDEARRARPADPASRRSDRPESGDRPARRRSADERTSDAGRKAPSRRVAASADRPTAPRSERGRPDDQAGSADRRRAQPQTIAARPEEKRPRRTAGQLRDRGAIEDLTVGLDD